MLLEEAPVQAERGLRERLDQYAAQSGEGAAVDALMRRLRRVRSAGPSTRDEMNER